MPESKDEGRIKELSREELNKLIEPFTMSWPLIYHIRIPLSCFSQLASSPPTHFRLLPKSRFMQVKYHTKISSYQIMASYNMHATAASIKRAWRWGANNCHNRFVFFLQILVALGRIDLSQTFSSKRSKNREDFLERHAKSGQQHKTFDSSYVSL